MSALLDLNRLLLQEVIALQTSGKSGTPVQAPSPPQSDAKTDGDAAAAMAPKAPPAGKMSFSKEYIECVSLSLSLWEEHDPTLCSWMFFFFFVCG